MQNLQKPGGIAALVEGITYIIGMVIAFTILAPAWELAPADFVQFQADNQLFLHVWHLLIYLVNGFFLIVLVLALAERLRPSAPAAAQISQAFGLIWAGLVIASGLIILHDIRVVSELAVHDSQQATTLWLALSAVESAIGGGIELPGGLWILLISWVGLQKRVFPRGLMFLGLVAGSAGTLSALPFLHELGPIFGISSILWFLWLGIFMLRNEAIKIEMSDNSLPKPHTAKG